MACSTIIKSCKHLDPKEEHIIYLDTRVIETVLALRNLIEIKNKLSRVPNLISDSFCLSLFEVTIEPTFPFPDFIHWTVKNYVKSNY